MIYIVSLALQISAGAILLLWSLGNARNNVLEAYFPGTSIVLRDDQDNCVLKKEKLQVKYKIIILNVFSFVDLVLGYVLSIFGVKNRSNYCTLALVVSFSISIILAEEMLSWIAARIKFKDDYVVKYSELQKYGVETIATDNELSEMMLDVFNDDNNKDGKEVK